MSNVPPEGQTELNQTIGLNIQKAMEEKHFTHAQLADATGIDRISITRYCNGQRQCPTVLLVKIANALDVNLDFLVGTLSTMSTDITVAEICKYTGLSEKAISVLHEYRHTILDKYVYKYYSTVLSHFIESTYLSGICEDIARKQGLIDSFRERIKVEATQQFSIDYHQLIGDLELCEYKAVKLFMYYIDKHKADCIDYSDLKKAVQQYLENESEKWLLNHDID